MGKLVDFQGVDVKTRNKDRRKTKLAFSIFALLFLVPFAIIPSISILQASSWEEVHCSVHVVKTKRRSFSGDYSHSYQEFFRYDYQGQEFQSSRFSFIKGVGLSGDEKEEIAKDFPYGKGEKCFLDSASPSDAVYDRGFHHYLLIWLAVPLVLLAWCWRMFGSIEVSANQ